MARVVLVGVEQPVANHLECALAAQRHRIERRPASASLDTVLDADIVFAGGDRKRYIPLLRAIRRVRPDLPFIVVTRLPETSHWLDALEAGATDYCSAPFEPRQIGWLLESALMHTRSAAAA